MLKWKKHVFDNIAAGKEPLIDILSGMSGKGRVIKKLCFPITGDLFVRIYRDAEQFVDFECSLLSGSGVTPIIDVDIPLAEGQLCKAGFYKSVGEETTPTLGIAYEESG